MHRRCIRASFVFLAACSAIWGQVPDPTVTSVTPNTAQVGSGVVPITVTGTGFNTCTVVTLDGNTLSNQLPTTVLSATQLQSSIPAAVTQNVSTHQIGAFRRAIDGGCLSFGVASTQSVPFSVIPPPPTITSTSPLPGATQNQPYSFHFTSTGGAGSIIWSLQQGSSIPPGLTFTTGGQLAGTPTSAGTFVFTVRVQDCGAVITAACTPRSDSRQFSLTVTPSTPAPSITTEGLPAGTACLPYQAQLTASGGALPLAWSATGLPPNLTINPSTGVISGPISQQASTASVGVRVTDALGRQSALRTFTLSINPTNLQISTGTLPSGRVGVAYNALLAATGGQSPYTFALSGGQLPNGITLVPAGALSGTPTVAGPFSPTFRVTDANSCSITKPLPIDIAASDLQITTTALNSGSVGTAYSQLLTATGGAPPYTWSTASGLPQGLSLSTGGTLSGTPLQPANSSVTIQVADSQQRTVSRVFSLQISSGLSIVTAATLPSGRVGQFYEQTLFATGGSGALTWQASNTPPGIFLNPTTGVLSGTPTSVGDFSIPVQVRDASGATANRTFFLSVINSVQILTETLPPATLGTPYNAALQATGGATPYRWLPLTPFPPGIVVDSLGVISGTPTETGSTQVQVQVTDNIGATATRQFVFTVGAGFTITTPGLPNGAVNVAYNQTLSSTGGRAPIRWTRDSGQIPPGLNLNENTGILNGTPTTAGDFAFTLAATDADQRRATKPFTITIRGQFRITTESLPNGEVNTAYSQTLATTGASTTVTWSVSQGNLPTGISLNTATGVISGTPTQANTFSFTIQAAASGVTPATQNYTVTIFGPPAITTQSLPNGLVSGPYSASLAASGGEPPYTWSSSNLPEGLSLDSATGAISGAPTTAGSVTFTVTVQDRGNRTASRQFTISIAAGLTVTTSSLAGGTVGIAYSQTLAAAGGATGRAWTVNGDLPPGLSLAAATGIISGTPRTAGTFPFTAAVRDSLGNTAEAALQIVIGDLQVPPFTIAPSIQPGPGVQPVIGITLSEDAPATILGTLSLAFEPGAGVNNPGVRFSTPGTPQFTIPAGSRQAVFAGTPPVPVAVQLGNVAGTVVITARLTAGGVDVTPNPAPRLAITITKDPPVIDTMTAVRNGNTITVEMTGFVTGLEVTSAEFQFVIRQGATVQTSSFTVPVGPQFTTWFTPAANIAQFGSAFKLTMPFTVTGDQNAITGVNVTLVNPQGRSQQKTANLP